MFPRHSILRLPLCCPVLLAALLPSTLQAQQLQAQQLKARQLPAAPGSHLLIADSESPLRIAAPFDFAAAAPALPQRQSDASTAEDSSLVTEFTHPDHARWWLSGQANIIYQGRIPFHSLYQGPNSFRNSAECSPMQYSHPFNSDARSRTISRNEASSPAPVFR